MRLLSFIKDKAGELILTACGITLVMLFMSAYSNSGEEMAVVLVIMLLITTARVFWEYLRRKRFYDRLTREAQRLDKKYLLSEMLDEPSFYEGRLFYDALYLSNKSMCENVSAHKRRSDDFREYIELWVHEIKLPVAALSLIAHNDTDNGTRYSPQIRRVDQYIENVLYYARSENAEKDYIIKEVPLRQLVKNSIIKAREELQLGGVSVGLSDLDVNVFTDAKWLEYIIGQLIDNSIKYKSPDREPKIDIYAESDEKSITLHFKDNGIGIRQSELKRIFDKSFTGTNGRSGAKSTGMGLYLVKKLCTRLGHGVSAASQEDDFTDISIIFGINDLPLAR